MKDRIRTYQPSRAYDPSVPSLRIAGFGACMISGYPHQDGGLFEVACRFVEESLLQRPEASFVSLGGFPAPRAVKYLKSRVLSLNPLYVVLQFGATDAQCPMRAASHRFNSAHSEPSVDRSYQGQPVTALSSLRWEMASLLGYLRKSRAHYAAGVIHRGDRAYGRRLPISRRNACRIVAVCIWFAIYDETRIFVFGRVARNVCGRT